MMKQAGPTTIQTEDWEKSLSPIQGEILIHHPGTHVPAQPTDPIVYYHDSGFKRLIPAVASPVIPWVKASSTSETCGGSGTRLVQHGSTVVANWSTSVDNGDGINLGIDGATKRPFISGAGIYAIDLIVYYGGSGITFPFSSVALGVFLTNAGAFTDTWSSTLPDGAIQHYDSEKTKIRGSGGGAVDAIFIARLRTEVAIRSVLSPPQVGYIDAEIGGFPFATTITGQGSLMVSRIGESN